MQAFSIGCLIVLDNIDMLFILKELYGSIIITQEVSEEFGKTVPEWVDIREVVAVCLFSTRQNPIR